MEATFLRLRKIYHEYPRQFWLMFSGMIINTIGSSMIWPFLTIYISQKLQLPLTTIASLLTLNATAALIASFLAGPVIDRLGRKWIMVFSLAANAVAYLFLSRAETLPAFAVLMGITGAVNPLYRVGADAMMADLLPREKRIEGYSLLRLANNLGISLGPSIGGFLASTSYTLAFYGAAVGMSIYCLLLTFFAAETLPKNRGETQAPKERLGGYPAILRDRPFTNFVFSFLLTSICTTLIWTLMGVYAKTYYQIPESQYGLIATTNAVMVVTLQLFITRITKRHPPLLVAAVGAFLYAAATFSVGFMTSFPGFWLSMIIMTLGELIIVPTASTYIANLAPVDKRGRYMSIFGLSWPVSQGIGPLLGGILSDNLGPRFIWFGGAVPGIFSIVAYLLMSRRAPASTLTTDSPSEG